MYAVTLLAFNLLYGQGWSWTDSPVSTIPPMPGLQTHTTTMALYSAGNQTQGFVHGKQVLFHGATSPVPLGPSFFLVLSTWNKCWSEWCDSGHWQLQFALTASEWLQFHQLEPATHLLLWGRPHFTLSYHSHPCMPHCFSARLISGSCFHNRKDFHPCLPHLIPQCPSPSWTLFVLLTPSFPVLFLLEMFP